MIVNMPQFRENQTCTVLRATILHHVLPEHHVLAVFLVGEKSRCHAGDSVAIVGLIRETGDLPVPEKATQNGNHNSVHV